MRGGHNKTHGHTYKKNGQTRVSSTYASWSNMIQRCLNEKSTSYSYYGGRGVKVCERWKRFENFLEDMGEKPDPNLTIDRIDNNGNYEKSNCRWENRKTQRLNQRKVKSNNKYFGVYKSGFNTWKAQCNNKYIGSFKNENDAALAYNIAAIKNFGELAKLNILEYP